VRWSGTDRCGGCLHSALLACGADLRGELAGAAGLASCLVTFVKYGQCCCEIDAEGSFGTGERGSNGDGVRIGELGQHVASPSGQMDGIECHV
jgi:hypothetical protein